ncbi:MAG: alpha/beta hydrolase [Pyrinomonadaceae bacterium]
MKTKITTIWIFAMILLCAITEFGQMPIKGVTDSAVAKLGSGFSSNAAEVNGTTIHYVRGGTGGAGTAVILIHGFPQDWYEFHKVMPRLAQKFTVIAVDLRGIGGSKATADGYDAANLAKDIEQLAAKLKLEHYYVAGHDMGGMVAYAFARQFPEKTRGVMILEAPLPGIEPWNEIVTNPKLWHVNFNQTPELPEKLVMGRQSEYLGYFFKFIKTGLTDAEATHYVNSYKSANQLRAGFELYRALPLNEKFNAAQTAPLELPLVLVGGEESFGKLIPRFAESLRKNGCRNVTTEIIKNAAHYVADEQPEAVAELIERYASVK